MMGQPLSLEEAKLKRAIDLQAISGNTNVEPRDNRPSHYTIFTIDYEELPDGVFTFDPSVPPVLMQDTVVMEIPAEAPKFAHADGISYNETSHPLAMNEVEVPDSELVAFNKSVSDVLPVFKEHFYQTAANLLAFDDAQEYVKAALRDGLDVGIELDGALLSAFVPISRLDAITQMVSRLAMPDEYKRTYLKKVSKLLAEKTMDVMHKHDVTETARETLRMNQELQHARIRASDKNSPNMRDASPVNTVGVTGSRR